MENPIIDRVKELIQAGIVEGNMGKLYGALTQEFKDKVSMTDLGKRIAEMEEHHGMFYQIGNGVSKPGEKDGEWIVDLEMKSDKTSAKWTAHAVITSDLLLKELNFSRAPFYISADYYNPHKVTQIEIQAEPKILYTKPTLRKTNKLPIAALVHATIGVDEDGHMGLCYPYKDFEFLSQKKIGLVRGSFKNGSSVIEMGNSWIDSAIKIPENGGLFLIIHSFAALFLENFLQTYEKQIAGYILLNPAWEGVPGSGLPSVDPSKISHGKPVLIIGSGNDQLLTRGHFDKWVETLPEAKTIWNSKTDHFLIDSDSLEQDYNQKEMHVNESVLRQIIDFIRENCSID